MIAMAVKSFKVFGEPVDVPTTAEMTDGKSSTMTQTSPPGGGPPPHRHTNEDETVYAMRGSVPTFRNAGSTAGKMLVVVTPGGFEKYLEEISPLSIPADMPQLLAISERYGISFPTRVHK